MSIKLNKKKLKKKRKRNGIEKDRQKNIIKINGTKKKKKNKTKQKVDKQRNIIKLILEF
jgi:hypothetical protein